MKTWPLLALLICLLAVGIFILSRTENGQHNPAVLNSSANFKANVSQDSTSLDQPLKTPLVNPKIVVNKSQRRLDLYCDSEIVRSYRIGLGFEPIGDKIKQGDGRTPEGKYYICLKNPNSRYYLSLGLSYPNIQDADRGLREAVISHQQHQQIVQAIKNGRTPPWDTPLGGEIFIHGYGSKNDWTLGCIALEDRDIQQLYEAVPIGAPVVIQP